MTRNTNACKSNSIVDERSATTGTGGGFGDSTTDPDSAETRAVNDDLLATLAEVET